MIGDEKKEEKRGKNEIDLVVDQLMLKKQSLHRLHRSWTYWAVPTHMFAKAPPLRAVQEIDSIEKFWESDRCVSLKEYHYLYLMVSNSSPKWEDPLNQNGCRWIFEAKDIPDVYRLFGHFMLGLIGETLMETAQEMADVNGIEMQTSPPKIKIWMKQITEHLHLSEWVREELTKCGCGSPLRSSNKISVSNDLAQSKDGFTVVRAKSKQNTDRGRGIDRNGNRNRGRGRESGISRNTERSIPRGRNIEKSMQKYNDEERFRSDYDSWETQTRHRQKGHRGRW